MFFISWIEHQLLKTASKVLAAPVTVPVKSASWLLQQIHGEAEAEQLDEDRVMRQLMDLQLRYEMEEIGKEEFQAQEKELLERLNAIREHKKDEQFEEDEAWWRRVFPEGFE
ncbi:MAG: gas vesicle protein GvpG [Anaerolineae bacterium]|nr:gas vesicle protein GvpG [Anaerolineae bacterium]